MRTTIKIPFAGRSSGQILETHLTVGRISAWRTPVAAAALTLALGFTALDVHALALGRVNVQSALGEQLRAEIDVPDINADEAASLRASVANPEVFRAAGLEYNAALSGLQISLQRRPDGRMFLRLTSDKPINEPFVDLILEANWASGRIVRDYTMLFDPANLRTPAAPSPVTSPSVAAPAPVYSAASPAPSAVAVAPVAITAPSKAAAPPKAPVAPRTAAVKAEPAAPKQGSVTVKAGNTAAQLASQYKPQGVSLDQMLVAMLSSNPDAFIGGNINRLKAGAVLDMPSAATATGTSETQARQTITAQSKDFNEFRRRLAEGAPTAATPSASRKASGSVQANVLERKPAATAPDKLTLSKGAVGAAGTASAAKGSKEEAIAKDKQAKDAAARTAELSKNILDLNKLSATTPASAAAKPAATAAPVGAASSAAKGVTVAAGAALPASAAVASASKTATPTATASAALTPVAAASAPKTTASASVASAATSTATSTASAATATVASAATATTAATTTVAASLTAVAPTAAVSAPKPVASVAKAPAPAPVPEPSLVDGLLDNPITLPAAGGLLILLAGFGFYRSRQRKNATQVDSSFLESRLQPDSFFGASGGQRIDTSDASGGGAGSSSMVYSPSQLDAAGDVDPVAEADVYLAYGRDLQAEEILKEAMRTNPGRVAVHAKLLEIYAKRRDAKSFESTAKDTFKVTGGQGAEWDAISALGREMDPANSLYQPGGSPSSAAAAGATADAGAAAFAMSTVTQDALPEMPIEHDVDFDLDLDFSVGDDITHSVTSPIHVQPTVSIKPQAAVEHPVDLSFDMPALPVSGNDTVKLSVPDMASFASGLNFSPAPVASSPAPAQHDALEFDLGSLSLDLDPTDKPSSASAASAAIDAGITGDPLETKLALAQEFREIGDSDGARSLAQEVATEAFGALKARAQRMVAELS